MPDPRGVDEQVFQYDVQLAGMPPASLRARYPDMTVRTTRAQTALRRRVEGPADLDALISEIGTVGLTVTDVHRVPSHAGGSDTAYEVRVMGEIGLPLLRHLSCAHYRVPELTHVRLALVARELNRFLQACTDGGARLERVCRSDSPSLPSVH